MAIVELKNVSKTYKMGKVIVRAVHNIDIVIEKGEFTAITGPSGSGKSTILNMMGLLDAPDNGTVSLLDEEIDYKKVNITDIRKKYIGFVFQTFNLIPVLTAYENVELPLLINNFPKDELRDKVMYWLDAVGLGDSAHHRPNELSGGQQQRVAIARALAISPQLVLADEPTANLDSKTGYEILDLMRGINEKTGTTFVFSTHDPKIIELSRRKIKIHDGAIEA